MRMRRTTLVLVCLTALSIAPAAARKLVVQAAPGFDAAAYRTFAFSTPPPENIVPGTDPAGELQQHIAAVITTELARVGWVPAAEGETPDLTVAYGGSGEPTEAGSRAVWVYDFWGGTGISEYGRQTQYVGWFSIGLLDGSGPDPVWQGWAKIALEPDEVKARRTIEKRVRQILRKLP